MVDEAKQARARAIAAVGTAGLRIARNSDAVVAEISAAPASTSRSSRARRRAAWRISRSSRASASRQGSLVVFDTGGGSSQFTFGSGAGVDERFSVDVGAVRYTERFGLDGAVSPEVLAEALAAISADLARLDGRPHPTRWSAWAGRSRTWRPSATPWPRTTRTSCRAPFSTATRSIARSSCTARATPTRARSIVGLQPKRADVILAGACIVRTVMEKLGPDSLTVSDRGLRHGVLAEHFGATS